MDRSDAKTAAMEALAFDGGRMAGVRPGLSLDPVRRNAARWTLAVKPQRPYVLCLGRRDQKYKNVELLDRFAPLLDAMGLERWMPGEVDEAFVARHVLAKPGNLRLRGRIDDDDLKKALLGALCFLFPSRIEGLGLPAVEAMSAGCPVVASTSQCLPEVCGDAALYADPDDIDGWAGSVCRIMSEPDLQRRLAEAGHARACGYSWRGIAETYLHLMWQVDLGTSKRMPALGEAR